MKLEEIRKKSCSCIYKLNFPNGRSYIGKAKNIGKRIAVYEKFYDDKSSKVGEAIKEFGLDSVDFEILSSPKNLSNSDKDIVLSVLEIKYIKEFDTIYPNGYNVSVGGEMLGIPFEYLTDYCFCNKEVLLYDINGDFVREYESISKCSYDLGIDFNAVSQNIDKRKSLYNKYIFKSKKYNYIPQKVDVSGIRSVERVKYKTIIVPKYVEKDINVGRPVEVLMYDENGDFVGEYGSKVEALRTFTKSNSVPFGHYHKGYVIYKKVSDDYPKKIEPYIDTINRVLGDTYKPMSECEELKVEFEKSDKVHKKTGKHSTLINDFKVRQFDDNGFSKVFDSIRDASYDTGIRYANIWACVFGRTKKSGGFYWEIINS